MVRLTKLVLALAAGSVLLEAPRALANGRFPSAQQIVVHPRDPNRIWQRATHGMLTSCDRGKSWRWICEGSVGYRGVEDPTIAVGESGKMLASFFGGLAQTADNGCNFALTPEIGDQNVEDVSVEKNDPKRVVAITSTGTGDGWTNEIWRSTDSGATWSKLGQNLDPTYLVFTIDVAPSDSKTIYVTAASYVTGDGGVTISSQGLLLRTTDDAQTWQKIEISGTDNETQPFLSAVHPTDPKKLYLRVRGPGQSGAETGFVKNQLLYSENGGDTWTKIFEADGDMLGFALSPDASDVLVGVGDSRLTDRPVDPQSLGLYRSKTSAFAFQRVSEPVHIGCLTFDGDELWVCGSQFHPTIPSGPTLGFEIGISRDHGTTIEKVMELSDPQPMQCACGSTTGDKCPGPWNTPTTGVCAVIGRCQAGGVPGDAGCGEPVTMCSLGTGGTTGAGGSGAAGGTGGGGTGGSAVDAGSGGSGAAANDDDDDGCGCRAPGTGAGSAIAFVSVLFGIGLMRVFRRKR
jgi:photosystem II stability/assembly factor-like uncharacterized protein